MDRCFTNNYRDLNNAQEVVSVSEFITVCGHTHQLTDEWLQRLKLKVESGFDRLSTELDGTSERDLSVYVGSAGIVMLFVSLHENSAKAVNSTPPLLQRCLPVCQRMAAVPVLTSHGSSARRQVSLLCGAVGGWAVAAVALNLLQQQQHDQRYQPLIAACLDKIKAVMPLIETSAELPDELLYGRVGYLAALLYLKQQCLTMEDIDRYIAKTVKVVLERGRVGARHYSQSSRAPSKSPPLMYTWHEKHYLGAAHGLAGILTLLLQAVTFISTDELKQLVRPTIDYLASLQLASGNFPSSLESASKDRLVQWCHGAAGFAHLFTLAYQVFHDDRYLRLARQSCDVVWSRGLLRKGHGLCHGTAGNAYAFLHLYQLTKDVVYLYRACCFADWCFHSRNCPPADRPLSLFEGEAGMIYLLSDIQRPLEAKFPAFLF